MSAFVSVKRHLYHRFVLQYLYLLDLLVDFSALCVSVTAVEFDVLYFPGSIDATM